jgi:alpha-ketoglutarate-dependent taurine dioxygenase
VPVALSGPDWHAAEDGAEAAQGEVAMMPNRTIEVAPVASALGAEIQGVDLREEMSAATTEAIRDAFGRYGVIFFRDQELSPEQHLAFARRWGEIETNRFFRPVDGYPDIAEVRKEPDQKQNIGSNWHTDHSYDQAPAMGSILYAREVPAVGGDTLFANMVDQPSNAHSVATARPQRRQYEYRYMEILFLRRH